MSSSNSSSSGTTNGGRSGRTSADRSSSAPPSSGTNARDNSDLSERATTIREPPIIHRQVRSVSTLEQATGQIASAGETSSPGGRRPWHRRAREMLAAAAAARAAEREELPQRVGTSEQEKEAVVPEEQPEPVGGIRSEAASSSSTQREAALIREIPPVAAGTASSSSSKPSRAAGADQQQQRVQVSRLREDALRVLVAKGYTPTSDPDGGISKMTPEEIEGFVPIGGSLGSLLHDSNECAPCLFYSKNRCLRGIKCLFCHEKDGRGHEGLTRVKQRIRPSKRTRNLLRVVREQHPDLPPEEMMKAIQDYKKDIIASHHHHKKS